ncbi:MAG TPA: hypothetical protein VG710_14765 [Opitutus sp.]|nr:hypothetical protein [Opitutus sp.]
MAKIFLAIFLLVFGLNLVVGVTIPNWVIGVLALIAGALILANVFGLRRGGS